MTIDFTSWRNGEIDYSKLKSSAWGWTTRWLKIDDDSRPFFPKFLKNEDTHIFGSVVRVNMPFDRWDIGDDGVQYTKTW
jgi:hypothetical protein